MVSISHPPLSYNRSQLALYWNILTLIRDSKEPVRAWLVTCGKTYPDSWFGRMFGNFVRNLHHAADRCLLPADWGGVRVFEPHPLGHGLHAHIAFRGFMNFYTVQRCAREAGLGIIFVRPEPMNEQGARYFAKYLNKEANRMVNVRKWACIGNFKGGRCVDIEFDSARVRRIKELAGEYRMQGMHRYAAFLRAKQEATEEVGRDLDVPF